jgi:hypothetical protein
VLLKVQHKDREITKCDRNDNRIKRWKVGERDVSSNEDPSPESSWSGVGQRDGGLERHVRVIHVVTTPCNRSYIVAAATDSRV